MATMTLQARAKRHWAEYLPEKTAELKAAGQWELATQAAALEAEREIDSLMALGYQLHEAEEVALAQFILLPAEENAEEEEDEELAELEREYQEMMSDSLALRDELAKLHRGESGS